MMKRRRLPPAIPAIPAILAALLAAIPPALRAAPPPVAAYRWAADPADPRPASLRVMRGSAALIEARFPAGLPDGSGASFLWQTNGMGELWWEAPATAASNALSVVWTPQMDSGADLHRAFFRLAQADGPDYSAYATLRMIGSPGAEPNSIPMPVERIDFAAVAWTNAPWALPPEVGAAVAAATNAVLILADARIAAATNAIPAPDMSAFVHKTGDTMTGRLDIGGRAGSQILLMDGEIDLLSQQGAESPDGYAWVFLRPCDITLAGRTGQPFSQLRWPSRSGTLAVEGSLYAAAAPWDISATMAAAETGATTYVVTNGDMAATYTRDAVYQDAVLGISVQDRPEPYSYNAPTGTWAIVDDAAGAAAGIVADGTSARLLSSRAASGMVSVNYDAGDAGDKTVSVWMSQTQGSPTKVGDDYDVGNSMRYAWQTNLLARLAAIDYSAADLYQHEYDGDESEWGDEYIARALSPFNDFGDAVDCPTDRNPDFFWPELAENLLPRSVMRLDLPHSEGPWAYSPVIFISPHWAWQAKHWNFAPAVTVCTNWQAGAFIRLSPDRDNRYYRNNGVDLALVRYKTPVPPQCIGKLITQDVLARVSPSLFKKACVVHFSQHGTIHPFAFDCGSMGAADWTAPGCDAATNACHLAHGGDSGQPIAIVTSRAQVIWISGHQSRYGGPILFDADNLAWIESILAMDGEAPTYWTAEELLGDE